MNWTRTLNIALTLLTLPALFACQDEDSTPESRALAFSSASVLENDTGTTTLVFDLHSEINQSVSYATRDITAAAGSDYVADSGTLNFSADSHLSVEIVIQGDTQIEATEVLGLNLTYANGDVETLRGFIKNDDFPTLSVEPAAIEEGHSGTRTMEFQLELDQATVDAFDVRVVTESETVTTGVADASSDYQAIDLDTVVPANEQALTVPVTVNSDTDIEPDESFNFLVYNSDDELIASTTGEIRNDDGPGLTTPTLSVDDVRASEPDEGDQVELTFVANLSEAPSVDYSMNYSVVIGDEDTATLGDDLASQSGTLIFPAGTTSQTITISVDGDDTYEDDEAFTLLLDNSAGYTFASAQGIIVNDDDPNVSIDSPSLVEGDSDEETTLTFTVSLDDYPPHDVTLKYRTADGASDDPARSNTDYIPLQGQLVFNSTVKSLAVPVTVLGDTHYEPDEDFQLIVSLSDGTELSRSSAVIENDEVPAITIQPDEGTDYREEPDTDETTEIGFTTELSRPASGTTVFYYKTFDDNATGGDTAVTHDYVSDSGQIRFEAGDTTPMRDIDITVFGDAVIESDEVFYVRIFGTEEDANNNENALAESAFTIVNDDIIQIGLTSASFSAEEGDPESTDTVTVRSMSPAPTLTVSGALVDSPIEVTVLITDMLDAETDDVSLTDTTVTVAIPVGDYSLTPETIDIEGIQTHGDTLVENDESFELGIDESLYDNEDIIVLGQTRATVTVLNDDRLAVRFNDLDPADDSEASPTARPTLLTENAVADDFDPDGEGGHPLTLSVALDSESTAEAADFETMPLPVDLYALDADGFSAGTEFDVLTIVDDDRVESPETARLVLDTTSDLMALDTSTASVDYTLISDDQLTVSLADPLQGSTYQLTESGDDSVDEWVGFTVIGGIVDSDSPALAFDITRTSGTAVSDTDFSATTNSVTIPIGDYTADSGGRVTLSSDHLAVIDDAVLENPESLTLGLAELDATVSDYLAYNDPDDSVEVTLISDDTLTLGFTSTEYSETEPEASGDSLTLTTQAPTLTYSGAILDAAVSVPVTQSLGTAEDDDLTFGTEGTETVILPKGDYSTSSGTTSLDSLVLQGDDTVEVDETVDFTIGTAQQGGIDLNDVTLSIDTTTFTLLNDDHVSVAFASLAETVTEANGSSSDLQFELSGKQVSATDSPSIAFDLVIENSSTATEDDDFTVQTTFTLPDGDYDFHTSTGIFDSGLEVLDDNNIEPTEVIELSLDNGTATDLSTDTAQLSIEDDDGLTVAFTEATYGDADTEGDSGSTQSVTDAPTLTVIGDVLNEAVDINVELDANSQSACADDDDFTFGDSDDCVSETVTLPAGDYSTAVEFQLTSLAINGDNRVEDNESLSLSIDTQDAVGLNLGSQSTANYTIVNDDQLTVSFTSDQFDDAEGDETDTSTPSGAPTFTVTGDALGSSGSIRIALDDTASAACEDNDDITFGDSDNCTYETVTLPAGDYSSGQTFSLDTLRVLGDRVIEADETFGFEIDLLGQTGYTLGSTYTTTDYTVTNDDDITVTFGQSEYGTSIEEADNESGTFDYPQIVVTGDTLASTVEIAVDLTPDSADCGTDYEFAAGDCDTQIITLPAGDYDSGVSFDVDSLSVHDDTLIENTESLTLTLDTLSVASVQTGSITSTDYQIVDDDVFTVAFESDTYDMAEKDVSDDTLVVLSLSGASMNGDSPDVVIGLNGLSNSDVSVSSSLTVSNSDLGSGTSHTVELPVAITDDDLVETNETYTLSLAANDDDNWTGSASTTLTIVNDDAVSVSFVSSANSGAEGDTDSDGTSNIPQLQISGDELETAQTVVVTLNGGTGDCNTDFTFGDSDSDCATETLTLSAQDYSNTVTLDLTTLAATGDTFIEDDETATFSVTAGTLDSIADNGLVIDNDNDDHTYTLTNDDAVTVAFVSSANSGAEGDTGSDGTNNVPQLQVSGDELITDQTVVVSLDGGTGTCATDYDFGDSGSECDTETLTLSAQDYSSPVTLDLTTLVANGDTVIEDDETATFSVAASTLDNIADNGLVIDSANDDHTYTLTNDDTVTVAFVSAANSGAEGDTDSDATSNVPQLLISGDELVTDQTVVVSLGNDGTGECGADYTFGDFDCDTETLTLTAQDYSSPVTLDLTTLDAIGDKVIEDDETATFSVAASTLDSIADNGLVIDSANDDHTYTLTNDDALTVAFSSDSFGSGTTENGTIDTPTLTISGAVLAEDRTVDISLDSTSITACENDNDFTFGDSDCGSETVKLAAGDYTSAQTVELGSLSITEDDRIESNESLTMMLDTSADANIESGAQTTASYHIINDDAVTVSFVSAANSGAEGDTGSDTASNVPQVQISGDILETDQTVVISLDGGTGTCAADGDFNFGDASDCTTETLTLSAQDYSGTVTLDLTTLNAIGDTVIEDDETATFSVTAGTLDSIADNGLVIDSANDDHTYTLTNDDAVTVSFVSAANSGDEGNSDSDTTSNVPQLQISGDELVTPQTVVVSLDGGTGTCSNDGDFNFGDASDCTTETLTLTAQDYSGSVTLDLSTLDVIGDKVIEDNETATFSVARGTLDSIAENGLVIDTDNDDHTYTLDNDDILNIDFSSATFGSGTTEDGALDTPSLTISGAELAETHSFTVALNSDSATDCKDNNDFSFGDDDNCDFETVTLAVGDYTSAQTVELSSLAITPDDRIESRESLTMTLKTNSDDDINTESQASTTYDIVNDDAFTVAFDQASYSVAENGDASSLVYVTLSDATLESDSPVVKLGFSALDSEGLEVLDTNDLQFPDSLVITYDDISDQVGSTSYTVAVPFTFSGDYVVETDDTYTLTLAANDNAYWTGTDSAVLTVTNDDVVTVSFVSAANSGDEGNSDSDTTSNVPQLQISGDELVTPQTVVVSLDGGTGTCSNDGDFNFGDASDCTTETLTLTAQDYSGSVTLDLSTLDVIGDKVIEDNETATFSVARGTLDSIAENGLVIDTDNDDHTYTLDNDDILNIDFSSATFGSGTTEDGALDTPSLTISGAKLAETHSFTVALNSDSATDCKDNNDFSFGDDDNCDFETVTLAVGDYTSAQTVELSSLAITPDDRIESRESLTMTLKTNSDDDINTESQASTTYDIVNDDAFTVAFDQASYSVAENGDASSLVYVTLSDATLESDSPVVKLGFSALDSEGLEVLDTNDLQFPDSLVITYDDISDQVGSTSYTVAVPFTFSGDYVVETDDTYTLTLAANDNAYWTGTDSAVLTVTNDDVVTVSFVSAANSGDEGNSDSDTTSNVPQLQISGDELVTPQTVVVSLDGGTGTCSNDGDFNFGDASDCTTETLTLTAQDYSGSVTLDLSTLDVIGDKVIEDNETATFSVARGTLDSIAENGLVIDTDNDDHTYTLDNDDILNIDFSSATFGSGTTEDGALDPPSLTISGAKLAETHSFTVALNSDSATDCKDNNDFSFGDDDNCDFETVTLAVGDYTSAQTVELSSLAITPDDRIESRESLTMTLKTNSDDDINTESQASTTYDIVNDDAFTVAFDQASYSVAENGDASSLVYVTLSDATLESDSPVVKLGFSALDSEGLEVLDTNDLQFPDSLVITYDDISDQVGSTSYTVAVPFTFSGDYVVETDDTYTLTLAANDNAYWTGTDSAVLTVTNDDVVTVSFVSAANSGDEGNSDSDTTSNVPQLQISGDELVTPQTVVVSLDGGTGTCSNDGDFNFGDASDCTTETLTLTAQDYSGSVTLDLSTLDVIGDKVIEDNETATFSVARGTLDSIAENGLVIDTDNDDHTYTLDNDDILNIDFSSATFGSGTTEDGALDTPSLTISGAKLAETHSFTVALNSDSATDCKDNNDFSFGDDDNCDFETVTLAVGDYTSAQTVELSSLAITPDDRIESRESLTMTLKTNSDDDINTESQASTTYDIVNDDAFTVAFDQASYSVAENGDASSLVYVTLSDATLESDSPVVKLGFSALDSEGLEVLDTNDLQFPDSLVITYDDISDQVGSTSYTVAVPFTFSGDYVVETDDTYTLTLAANDNAYWTGTDSAVLTVTNDDVVTVSFVSAANSGDEGNSDSDTTSNVPQLQISGDELVTPQTVVVSLDGGTGTCSNDGDFNFGDASDCTTETLTLTAQDYSGSVTLDLSTLDVIGDKVIEDNETATFSVARGTLDSIAENGLVIDTDNDDHTYTLDNDDILNIDFSSATFGSGTTEDGALDPPSLTISGAKLAETHSFTVALNSDSATDCKDNNDFSFGDDDNCDFETVTLAVGDYTSAQTVELSSLAITPDDRIESRESLTMTLKTNSDDDINTESQASTTYDIVNDDAFTVAFDQASYSVAENGDASSLVYVTLSDATLESDSPVVKLGFSALDSEGLEVLDTNDLQFPDSLVITYDDISDQVGSTSYTVAVPFTFSGDDVVETDDTYTLTLAANDNTYWTGTDSADLTVTNDDVVTVNFDQTAYTEAEDASTEQIELMVSGAIFADDQTVTVSLNNSSTNDSPADCDTDFDFNPDGDTCNSLSVTIPQADYTSASKVTVPTFNSTTDTRVESDETAVFDIAVDSYNNIANNGLVIGDKSQTTFTMTNDDALTAEFNDSISYEDFENASNATAPQLTVKGTTDITVSIDFITGDTSALDYTAQESEFSVYSVEVPTSHTDGDTYSVVVNLTNSDDETLEWNEVTVLELDPLTEKPVDAGTTSSIEYRILNDDWTTFVHGSGADICAEETATVDCASAHSKYDTQDTKLGQTSLSVTSVDSGTDGDGVNWTCVEDDLTGLTWAYETSTPATYSDAEATSTLSSAANVCGITDWRLPTLNELMNLMDFSNDTVLINPTAFPQAQTTGADFYWSSFDDGVDQWTLSFHNGTLDNSGSDARLMMVSDTNRSSLIEYDGSTSYSCAAADSALPSDATSNHRFTVTSAGSKDVIIDNLTGLRWLAQSINTNAISGPDDWGKALDLADNEHDSTTSIDWRAPTVMEALSLLYFGCDTDGDTLDDWHLPHFFLPLEDSSTGNPLPVMTSTPVNQDYSVDDTTHIWTLDLSSSTTPLTSQAVPDDSNEMQIFLVNRQ